MKENQPKKRQPELSIITLNFNGYKDTCDLIDSIIRHVTLSYELIIVDNGSTLNEAASLQKLYPGCICHRNEVNLGFSGGNNSGIKLAKGKYILLINNDTYVKNDSFHFLIERLKSDPKIGAVSPKIKFAALPENIQYAGYTFLSPITLRNNSIGYGQIDSGQFDIATSTPYLHGASMMIKRTVIEEVGLMPEVYFLYYEELDWSVQMRDKGYILYYEPRCTVFHKESQSTGQNSYLRTFYLTRNRLLYAYRNLDGITRWLSIIYQILIVFLKNVLIFSIRRRPDQVKAAILGIIKFLSHKNKRP